MQREVDFTIFTDGERLSQSPEGSDDDFHGELIEAGFEAVEEMSQSPEGSDDDFHSWEGDATDIRMEVSIPRRVRRRFPPRGWWMSGAVEEVMPQSPEESADDFHDPFDGPGGCPYFQSQSPEGSDDDFHPVGSGAGGA